MTALYKLSPTGGVIRTSDMACIPEVPGNRDWAEYLDWFNQGNTPDPAYSLAEVRTSQIEVIRQACAAAITSGFTSSALGAPYTYPSQMTDQQNLSSSILASVLPGLPSNWTTPFWCTDASGNAAYRDHTAAQIQQVGVDGKTTILEYLTKKQGLEDQINAAGTIEAVQAITW